MRGERLIWEENQNFHEIYDFLDFRGIDLAEAKRGLAFLNFFSVMLGITQWSIFELTKF